MKAKYLHKLSYGFKNDALRALRFVLENIKEYNNPRMKDSKKTYPPRVSSRKHHEIWIFSDSLVSYECFELC